MSKSNEDICYGASIGVTEPAFIALEKEAERRREMGFTASRKGLASEAILEKYSNSKAAGASTICPAPADPDAGYRQHAAYLLRTGGSMEAALKRIENMRPASARAKVEAEILKAAQNFTEAT